MSDFANDFDQQRLTQLVNAKCNGELDDDTTAELESLLNSSPAARESYWQAMKIHADLECELSSSEKWRSVIAGLHGYQEDLGDSDAALPADRDVRARPISTRTRVLLALAACLLIAAFIGLRGPWRDIASREREPAKPTVVPHLADDASVLGRLTPLVPNSRWSFGRRSDRNSPDVFLGDTISVDVGAVALRFRDNVVAQMKAPLVLHVDSSEHVRLLHGRIQVDVPVGAEGFSVETASAEIIDLGTSFSVEVVDGGTDLIVREGQVDLKVTGTSIEDRRPDSEAKRFRGGEAVRVHQDGTLSRIANVHSSDILTSESIQSENQLIASVRDNLIRDDMWSFYEIVPGGLVEDAKAFVDRPHEWNGATNAGLPNYLVGADYVKTFNDDKVTTDLRIELELLGPAEVYVFLDMRLTPPSWLLEQFRETGDIIGIDESHDEPSTLTKVGPGASIDQTMSVWKLVADHGGIVTLGPNGEPGPHDQAPIRYVPSNMYGIAVVGIAEDDQ